MKFFVLIFVCRFPSDPFRCAEWVSIVAKERGEELYKPYQNSTLCSIHFDRLDISGNTQRRRLLKTAVPKLQVIIINYLNSWCKIKRLR